MTNFKRFTSVLRKIIGVLLILAPIFLTIGCLGGWDHFLGTMFILAWYGLIIGAVLCSFFLGLYLLDRN